MDESALGEDDRRFLAWLKDKGIVREAGFLDYLTDRQKYRTYPARRKCVTRTRPAKPQELLAKRLRAVICFRTDRGYALSVADGAHWPRAPPRTRCIFGRSEGCNFACRHCFMSAPHAKHGAPTLAQLVSVADQLAECGVFDVGITGGELLIGEDLRHFFENGWEERLTRATEEPFRRYLQRNPPSPSIKRGAPS